MDRLLGLAQDGRGLRRAQDGSCRARRNQCEKVDLVRKLCKLLLTVFAFAHRSCLL